MAVLCAVASMAAVPIARADNLDYFANYDGTSTWEDGNNWFLEVPTNNDSAYIDSGFSVTSSAANNVASELQVGVGTNAYGSKGNPGGTGALTLLSGSTITTVGNLVVGQDQTSADTSGTITLNSGSTLNIGGANSFLGFFGQSLSDPTVGTVNVNGGTFNFNAGNNNGTLWVGGESLTNHVGRGVLTVNSGQVNGAAIRVGDFGSGTMTVNGGTVTSNFYMSIGLGNNTSAGSGSVTVNGGTMNLAQMTVNESKVAACSVTQTGGTVNIGNVAGIDGYNFRVGLSNSGKGTYSMSAGTLNVAGTDLSVGPGSNGEFDVSGTAAVNVNTMGVANTNSDYGLALGGSDNGTAVVNQTGGTVNIATTSLLGVFFKGTNGGTSTYNLSGGTLTTNGISADTGSTAKTFNFNGGALVANQSFAVPNPARTASPASFFTTISSGGATVNSGGFNVTWNTPLTGAGALTKSGAGSLILTAADTYGGATTVSQGTLQADNTTGSATGAGAVTVAAGGTLAGTGTVAGSVQLAGTVSPGDSSVGNLSIGNTLSMSGTAALISVLSNSGVNLLNVGGQATVGGSLNLSLANGFSSTVGTSYTILDDSSALATLGSFNNAPGGLITTGGYTFLVNYAGNSDGGLLANDITLTTQAAPVPEPTALGVVALASTAMLRRGRRARS